jgi:hypothetical protein
MAEQSNKPVRRWWMTRRSLLLLAAFVMVPIVLWIFWPHPPDLLQTSTRLLRLDESTGTWNRYSGRLSTQEILLLRFLEGKAVSAVALDVSTRQTRPLLNMTTFLNKRLDRTDPSLIEVRLSPNGKTVLWTTPTHAGLTDIEASYDKAITLNDKPIARHKPNGKFIVRIANSTYQPDWSPDGKRWMLTKFEHGLDISTPTEVMSGQSTSGKIDARQTNVGANWMFDTPSGVTNDGYALCSNTSPVVISIRSNSTGPEMHIDKGNLKTGASGYLKLDILPDNAGEGMARPSGDNRLTWQYRTASDRADNRLANFIARWWPLQTSQSLLFAISREDGSNGRIVGQIGPIRMPQFKVIGQSFLIPYYVSSDGHTLDFEWSGWLYTTTIP